MNYKYKPGDRLIITIADAYQLTAIAIGQVFGSDGWLVHSLLRWKFKQRDWPVSCLSKLYGLF